MKLGLAGLVGLALPVATEANPMQTAALPADAPEDVIKHRSCPLCGMNRYAYAHSRMMTVMADASTSGVCSLRCFTVDFADTLDTEVTGIFVADMNTKKLLPVEEASWVIQDGTPGVMTRNAKWAFERTADAEAFVQAKGGRIVKWDDAVKQAYLDLFEDTQMIRMRRKAKRTAQGK